jgi:hypothetical protein
MSVGPLTHCGDSVVQVGISVFTVHIVDSAAGVVFDPDTEVLDISGVLFSDLNE